MQEEMVYIVDDDPSIQESLKWVFDAAGIKSVAHQTAETFLANVKSGVSGCLLLDLQMPGKPGLDLLRELKEKPNFHLPVIVLSGTVNVESAVIAMKIGVVDVLEKPVNPDLLLERVRAALQASSDCLRRAKEIAGIDQGVSLLSERELEVCECLCKGLSSKQIARHLNIAIKTVSNHRQNISRKMKSENTPHLVRMLTTARLKLPMRTDGAAVHS